MAIKILVAKLEPEDESLDSLTDRTQENLSNYALKHGDFSAVIEKHVDENYILVKSIMLNNHAN